MCSAYLHDERKLEADVAAAPDSLKWQRYSQASPSVTGLPSSSVAEALHLKSFKRAFALETAVALERTPMMASIVWKMQQIFPFLMKLFV